MDVIQSYNSIVGKYSANDYERRILLHIVKMAQEEITTERVRRLQKIRNRRIDNIPVSLSAQMVMPDGSQHYEYVKNACLSLMKKTWQFYDYEEKTWYATPVIYNLTYIARSGELSFYVAPRLYEAILDFSRGFCKYDLHNALTLKHDSSVRLFAIFAKTRKPLTYTVHSLRAMFSCEHKYPLTADFIKRVIKPAVQELSDRHLNGCTMSLNRDGRKIVSITFTPVVREETNVKDLLPRLSVSSAAGGPLFLYLTQFCGFSTHELGAHKRLLSDFSGIPNHCDILGTISGHSRDKANPKGYIINGMKNEVLNYYAKQKTNH